MKVTSLLLTSSILSLKLNSLKMNPVCLKNRYNLPISFIRRSTSSSVDNKFENVGSQITWNLKHVKFEVSRQYHRTFQKLVKLNKVEITSDTPSSDAPVVQQYSVEPLQVKLKSLNDLNEKLQSIKSSTNEHFSVLIPHLINLGITPGEPEVPKTKKEKLIIAPRLPYHVYKSSDDIEIWVGRTAEDNDELSCNSKLRHNNEWWLHAAGCAGSHVVIKCTDDDLPTKYRQTVLDAAYLAAVNSKAHTTGGGNRSGVNLTRCRNISKPRGAVAGLVHLSGECSTVSITPKKETERKERLKRV